MLYDVGCILRMPGSSMIFVYLCKLQGENPYLGMVLNTKETLSDFLWKWFKIGLLGTCPLASVTAGVGSWQKIAKAFGFSLTRDLGKYLGVPLCHKQTSSKSFIFVTNKLVQRLTSWEANFLSLAGEITLFFSSFNHSSLLDVISIPSLGSSSKYWWNV